MMVRRRQPQLPDLLGRAVPGSAGEGAVSVLLRKTSPSNKALTALVMVWSKV